MGDAALYEVTPNVEAPALLQLVKLLIVSCVFAVLKDRPPPDMKKG